MFTLTIRVADLADVPIPANAQPEVIFTPSDSTTTIGGTLITAKPKTVPLGLSGTGIVDLVSVTDIPKANFHYTLAVRWLNPDGYTAGSGYTAVDFPNLKLYPGTGTGGLADIVKVDRVNSQWIYVSLVEPTNPPKGLVWLNADLYDPNLGTGDLKEFS